MSSKNYDVIIERGHSEINDRIIDFLKPKIQGRYLDVGCNTGWLLEEVPNGVGVEPSAPLVKRATNKGLNVIEGSGEKLPFEEKEFDTVVLSCVLEQCEDWRKVLKECRRVGKRVIGINPYPGSPWGIKGGWVKSIIQPYEFITTERLDSDRYYFEI